MWPIFQLYSLTLGLIPISFTLFLPLLLSILSRAAPILPAFPGTILLSNTSPSYPHILTLCLIASVLSHFSLPLSSLPPFTRMLPLIISLKSLPNVTPVSTHHSRSAPDSCWVAPTPSHSTLVESHSVSDLPLFTHIGPHFPHFTHLGPSDLHPLSLCCIIASSSPSSALYFHPLSLCPSLPPFTYMLQLIHLGWFSLRSLPITGMLPCIIPI